MKKNLTLLSAATSMAATLVLTGCATTGANTSPATSAGNAVGTATTIGMNVLKAAVDTQCRATIEKHSAWRVAQTTMTQNQQEAIKTKVCGCVSEQAPQHITIVDMTNAAIDAKYRTQMVTQIVAKSLQSCYADFTQS